MRPLRLELEGFSTFRERTVLDFADLELVALTGSTGAGKSTVIDAMTFALYGSVARYGNTGVVEPVIHQLATEAKVRFDFEVGGRHFVATRVTRRQQSRSSAGTGHNAQGSQVRSRRATTKEARLERVVARAGTGSGSDSDSESDSKSQSGELAETEVLAGSVKELDAAVVELLGLTFSQFTRTVVLPQGEFANFLTDEPTKRQDLLKRLLDLEVYGRMGSEARRRADAADQQASTLSNELARLDVPDEAALDELDARATALAGFRKEALDWLSDINAMDEALAPLRDQASQLQLDIDALGDIAVPEELESLTAVVSNAEEAVSAAIERASSASELLASARHEADRMVDSRRLLEHRQQLVAAEEASNRLEAVAKDIEALDGRIATLNEQYRGAEQQRSEAIDRLAVARNRVDGAHLARDLTVGDTCPVCLRAVDDLPDHPDISRGSIAESEQAVAEAATAVETLGRSLASAEAELKSLTEQRAVALEAVSGPDVTLGAASGSRGEPETVADVDAMLAAVKEAGGRERELADALAVAERAVADSRAELDRARSAADEGRQEFGRQRDTVVRLGPPEASFESLHQDWASLAQWSWQRRADLVSEREELVVEGRRKRSERDDLVHRVVARSVDVGIDISAESVHRVVEHASVAEADLRAERKRLEEVMAHAERLNADIEQRRVQQQLNKELGRHLSAKGFEAWLLAEAFEDITGRATARLLELSGGRFSLAALERDIAIIDHHNADEQRIARTLSGGETFLASLALALALADSIAALAPVDAPRLESMFLDEGFGTLDPDTLDVVATAIEELAASGRMIGIVTHVRDLAERMPARFEITKLPSGSTAELVTV